MTTDSFGARLRYERERRQIALKSIAEVTHINIGLLEGLERDDVSRWPPGIFRTSFVRAYATAIGLDPDPVVLEFRERHPDPLEAGCGASDSPRSPEGPSPPGPLAIRLTIAWSGTPLGGFGSRMLAGMRKKWLAWRGGRARRTFMGMR